MPSTRVWCRDSWAVYSGTWSDEGGFIELLWAYDVNDPALSTRDLDAAERAIAFLFAVPCSWRVRRCGT